MTCWGVWKSGSPISRWMMERPCASSALARCRTSKAPSTKRRSMRSASWIMLFLKDRKLIAVLDELDAIADGDLVAGDTRGETAACIEGNDGDLVGCFVHVLFGR